jgi:hypothetical protein
VLAVQVLPLLVVTKEMGLLVPVPTMMQLVADVHAMSKAPKKLLLFANPAGPVTEVHEAPASVVMRVTKGPVPLEG